MPNVAAGPRYGGRDRRRSTDGDHDNHFSELHGFSCQSGGYLECRCDTRSAERTATDKPWIGHRANPLRAKEIYARAQSRTARIDSRHVSETQHARNTVIRIGSLQETPKSQHPNPKPQSQCIFENST